MIFHSFNLNPEKMVITAAYAWYEYPRRHPTIMTKVWVKGDRCRVNNFGEWTNGTIVALVYDGEVAMVVRDGYVVEKAFLVRNLQEPIEEKT